MPLIRIDVNDHYEPAARRAIADAIHRSVVDVLGIPENDRFQIISPHQPGDVIALDAGLGFDRSTGVVIVQIFTQRGRSVETKSRLFAEIARALVSLGIRGEDVFVGLNENGPDDWSFGFGAAQYVTGDLAVPHAGGADA
jgi:phenylpyruvate tautomerase PptA (4-oxalocrotonate tautomerase family)